MKKSKFRVLYVILAAALMVSAAMVAVGVSNSRIAEAAAAATQTPAQQTSEASPTADPTPELTPEMTPDITQTPQPTDQPINAEISIYAVAVADKKKASENGGAVDGSVTEAETAGETVVAPEAADREITPVTEAPIVVSDNPEEAAEPGVYQVENTRFGIDSTGGSARATTDGINEALVWAKAQGYTTVKFDKGTYMVQCNWRNRYIAPTDGILVPSGLTLDLGGSTFKMEPNSYPEYTIFGIVNANDVTIKNGTLIGDLDNHVFAPSSTSPTHEFGFGVCISASRNVVIRDLKISKTTGDGIIVEGSYSTLADGGSVSTKVRLLDNEIFNCRRQGISVIGMRDSEIAGNEIYGIKGADPQYGIDIEKELDYIVDKLKIHDNVIYDCSGGAISCHSGTDYEVYNNVCSGNVLTVYSTNIKLYSNTIKNSFIQVMRGSSNITVENNIMEGNSWVQID